MAQSSSEPRAIKGGDITVDISNIPDAETVNRKYTLDRSDGTVNLPYLSSRVRAEGMTSRQLENLLTRFYKEQKIYSEPIVAVKVTDVNISDELTRRTVQVTGFVGSKKSLPYTEGLILIEALLECGDISDFGSRRIQVTRKGVTRSYDYYSARDRAIKLYPNDMIFVPKRGTFEGRPATLLP